MVMPKTHELFVIFTWAEQYGRPGTMYYAKDGSITDRKHKAAHFRSIQDAEDFAQKNKIEMTSVKYIGLESFSDFDLSVG